MLKLVLTCIYISIPITPYVVNKKSTNYLGASSPPAQYQKKEKPRCDRYIKQIECVYQNKSIINAV